MDTATRLQISYVALGVTVFVALAELVAALAHVSLGGGWPAPFIRMAGLAWAPAFYAVAFYRRRLAQERGG
jgi:hypothetical protein